MVHVGAGSPPPRGTGRPSLHVVHAKQINLSNASNASNASKSGASVSQLSSYFLLVRRLAPFANTGQWARWTPTLLVFSWLIVSSSKLILEPLGPLSNENAEVAA